MKSKYSYLLILVFVILIGAAIWLFLMKELDWRGLSLIAASSVLGIVAQLCSGNSAAKNKEVA